MRHIIFTSVACQAVPCFPTVCNNQHQGLLNTKCVFWFSVRNFSFWEEFRAVTTKVQRSWCKGTILLLLLLLLYCLTSLKLHHHHHYYYYHHRRCYYYYYYYYYYCQSFIENKFPPQIFAKWHNIRFYENPSSGSRFVQCGRTDRQTATTKETVSLSLSLSVANFGFESLTIRCRCPCHTNHFPFPVLHKTRFLLQRTPLTSSKISLSIYLSKLVMGRSRYMKCYSQQYMATFSMSTGTIRH